MKRIRDLYEAMEHRNEFAALEGSITAECEKRLGNMKDNLSSGEYEQVRDIVFSVSSIAQKTAFEIGFREGVSFVLECRNGVSLHDFNHF